MNFTWITVYKIVSCSHYLFRCIIPACHFSEGKGDGNPPRVLFCGHFFCTSCLLSLQSDGVIRCPECEVNLPVILFFLLGEEVSSITNQSKFKKFSLRIFDLLWTPCSFSLLSPLTITADILNSELDLCLFSVFCDIIQFMLLVNLIVSHLELGFILPHDSVKVWVRDLLEFFFFPFPYRLSLPFLKVGYLSSRKKPEL